MKAAILCNGINWTINKKNTIYTYIYIYIYVYIYIRIYICVYLYVDLYACVYMNFHLFFCLDCFLSVTCYQVLIQRCLRFTLFPNN